MSLISLKSFWRDLSETGSSLHLHPFTHVPRKLRRRKWQPTPLFLPRESCGQRAWWAAVHRVAQSRTWLKQLSSHSSSLLLMHINHSVQFRKQAKMKVAQSCLSLCDPMDCTVHGISPGQNTGVGSLSLLQGIFPTQGSNPGLRHCRWILCQLSHQES